MSDDFYWRNNRDSILTPAALQMFQILSTFDGQDYDANRSEIDKRYSDYTGKTYSKHGGIINTWIRAFQEAGWVTFEEIDSKNLIRITAAGHQALGLLGKLPDFLKAAPAFVIELLSRYQLNNPAQPEVSKSSEYEQMRSECDVFPYWTLFKVMRAMGNTISADELRRFVFKIQRSEDIDTTIAALKEYRAMIEGGASDQEINEKFPAPLEGAVGEPKYVMGRLGTQVGSSPSVVEKPNSTTWKINDYYVPFIDEILAEEPVFRDYPNEESWMATYGRSVEIDDRYDIQEEVTELQDDLDDDDPMYKEVQELVDANHKLVLFSGPPGTGKTWYAHKVAIKLVECDSTRLKRVQFHPSYAYEDFVEGMVPEASASGMPTFRPREKVFLQLSEAAMARPDKLHVLVIDEFTRGDPSRIFGELLTYLEYRDTPFHLPISRKTTYIPSNVVILATMNPYDKSVSELDDALVRRFSRIKMESSVEDLTKALTGNGVSGQLMGQLVELWKYANKEMPHGFGHAYFYGVENREDFRRLWDYQLSLLFEKVFQFEPDSLKILEGLANQVFEIEQSDSTPEPESPEGGAAPEAGAEGEESANTDGN